MAGREREQGPGEPVPAEVRGLPRRLGPALGQGRGDRPTDLGAAAVAAAVGADEPERAVVRRPATVRVEVEAAVEVEVQQGLRVGQHHRAHVEAGGGGAGVEDADPRAGLAAVPADQLHPHAGQAGEVVTDGLGQPALRDRLATPRPGVLDEQEGRVGRGGAGDRLAVVATGDGAAEVGHGGQSARGQGDRPDGGPDLRAVRCAARWPRPRCGRRRRACRGCWRRAPTRSWWR